MPCVYGSIFANQHCGLQKIFVCQHDVKDIASLLSKLFQSLKLAWDIVDCFGEHALHDLAALFMEQRVFAVDLSWFRSRIVGRIVTKKSSQSEVQPPSSVIRSCDVIAVGDAASFGHQHRCDPDAINGHSVATLYARFRWIQVMWQVLKQHIAKAQSSHDGLDLSSSDVFIGVH
jgi:hypothetical protein